MAAGVHLRSLRRQVRHPPAAVLFDRDEGDRERGRDPERVSFGSLPDEVKETVRSMNRDGKVETVSDLGDGMYAVEYR